MSQPYIDFAFVKENASFERVLAHYSLDARGTGTQRSISCPFHRPDKRPSCRIELDRKIFHCFSCEASGNLLEFVARIGERPTICEERRLLLPRSASIPPAPAPTGPRQAGRTAQGGAEAAGTGENLRPRPNRRLRPRLRPQASP